jgi:IclR family transcriptional regulator, acetate operon repressor
MAKEQKKKAAKAGMSSVRAVDRAIAILQCFSAEQPAMSVIEIQKRVGLSRPTLYRLLHTLSTRGLIHAEGDPQRFKLAQGVMKLSHVWLKGLEVVNVARPIVESLRDATGETAALFSLQEDRSVCVLECESRHVLSISRGIGVSTKITQGGATGKAMLAFIDPARQAELLRQIRQDAQRSQLEDALKSARRRGYAISRGEIFVGAVAVSAPYFDHRGSVVGSIGLYGPNARVNDDKLVEFGKLVCEAGRKVSALLGFQGSEPLHQEPELPRARQTSRSRAGNVASSRAKRA